MVKKCYLCNSKTENTKDTAMKKKIFGLLFSLLFGLVGVVAQEASEGSAASPRRKMIRTYEAFMNNGQYKQGVEQGVKAVQSYYKDNLYQEAFDLLRIMDQAIENTSSVPSEKAALHYQTCRERMLMYMKLHRGESALAQLNRMSSYAAASSDEAQKRDLLYNKTVYYYSFGQTEQGNASFKEMASQLMAKKEYDKVDAVYKALIASGRRSNSAGLVAQSYQSYMAWKDSVNALKTADEIGALKKRIAQQEATISEQDGTLTIRHMIIVALCILAVALAAVLIVGGVVLMRYILLTRRQKNAIRVANENNALKAKFIGNISAQLDPVLNKLKGNTEEVKALCDFSKHIQTMAELESNDEPLDMEGTMLPQYCEALMDEIKERVKKDVTLTVNAPKMVVSINRPYVSHIIYHLLCNAAEYTPEGGHITLDYKKRGAHTHQFIVSDTGVGIPEEKHEDIFKPFVEVHDLTKGDGLGLPICRLMAIRMDGELTIDPTYTKGARFILELHA